MDCCSLFADEAFFAGDPRHIDVLKALITEQTIAIERKFVDAHQGRNRLGIMMASNSTYVVAAGKDARRFFCLDVPDARKGDRALSRSERLMRVACSRGAGFRPRSTGCHVRASKACRSRRGPDTAVKVAAYRDRVGLARVGFGSQPLVDPARPSYIKRYS